MKNLSVSDTTAAYDATSNNITNTTYTTDQQSTLAVTVVTGTTALVFFAASQGCNTAVGNSVHTSVKVSGATTVAASDDWNLRADEDSIQYARGSMVHLFTGLTPGSNTFTVQSRTQAAAASAVSNREIIVTPL